MENLINKLKKDIIEALRLENVTPQSIDPNAQLFVEGLGLDSIDALELIVMLDKKYGIKINSAEEGKKILYSVKTMAEYIEKNK
jgi:acyl carrier protein